MFERLLTGVVVLLALAPAARAEQSPLADPLRPEVGVPAAEQTALSPEAGLPRLDDSVFSKYGYFEETRSALRYARQVAILGNSHITVALSANGFRICRGDACPGNGYLINPAKGLPWDGSATGQGRAPQGVSMVTSLASVTFDGLGRPSASGTLGIGPHTLTIEPETGYVH
ncbi:MAG: GspH/FimT family protein [Halothiobacillaceae bacterium]